MLSIVQDSEFMKNLLPASPIKSGKRFKCFDDVGRSPGVFALSDDNKLNLIFNRNGRYDTLDFGKLWFIQEPIAAFDMQQSSDGSLYIAISTNSGDKNSRVYLISDILPRELDFPQLSKKLDAGDKFPSVYDIIFSDFMQDHDGLRLPMTFLSFAPPQIITKASQLGYLQAKNENGKVKFTLDTSWSLKTEPVHIIGVTWVTCPLGSGPVVLYEASNGLHLQFSTFTGGSTFAVELQCPAGAASLTSVPNSGTGWTDLFVGGDQITYFAWRQYTKARGTGTIVTNKEEKLGVKNMNAVGSADQVAVWYSTSKKSLAYYFATTSSITAGDIIPFLPEGKGSDFSPLMIQKGTQASNGDQMSEVVNALISVDSKGQLSLLECPLTTEMWQSVPLYTPSSTSNLEVSSYTLRFRVVSDNAKDEVQGCHLLLKSSGIVAAILNGEQVTIDQNGAWYPTDREGVLSIIVSTADAASYNFQVQKYKSFGGSIVDLETEVLNPNIKVNEKLAPYQTGKDLLNAKTQDGKDLIKPGTVDEQEADDTADMLRKLNERQLRLGQPTRTLHRLTKQRSIYNPSGESPKVLAGRLPEDSQECSRLITKLSLSVSFSPWSVFHWVKEMAEKAKSWLVETATGAWSFIVDVAGKFYYFLLDSIEAVGKAMTWVFEKIKVGIQKLIDFIGFLFAWRDILTMANNISTYFNAAMDYTQDQLSGLKELKDIWLADLKKGIAEKKKPISTNSGPDAEIPGNTTQLDDMQDSVSYNWSTSRIKESGMDKSSNVKTTSELDDSDVAAEVSLETIWKDLQKIFESLMDTALTAGDNIKDLFTPGTNATDVFARMTNLLINTAIDQAGNVADLLIDVISLVLSKIQKFLNAKVEIPIFTALWNVITLNDLPCTVLNALSLMLAVPATILYKVIRGSAPPSLKGLTKVGFGEYINNKSAEELIVGLPVPRTVFFAIEGVIAAHCLLLIPLFKQAQKLGEAIANKPNIIDGGMIVFGCLGNFVGWPKANSSDMDLRYAVWGLEISNTVALGLSCFARWLGAPIEREKANKALLVWECLTGVPVFIIRIVITIKDHELKTDEIIRYTIADTLTITKSISNAVMELVDEANTKAVATGIYYSSFALLIITKIVNVNIDALEDPKQASKLREALIVGSTASQILRTIEK